MTPAREKTVPLVRVRHVLEEPGALVARDWTEEDGEESRDAWVGRALRELVRRCDEPPEPYRVAPGDAAREVPPAPPAWVREVVRPDGGVWRRSVGGRWARVGDDGRETHYVLDWEQLSGLAGGVSWDREDGPPPVSPDLAGASAPGQLSFQPYADNSGAGRWAFLTSRGIVVCVEAFDLDADVEARHVAELVAEALR